MSRNLMDNSNHQNYGAINSDPEVAFSGFSPTEFCNLCDNIVANIGAVQNGWKLFKKVLKSFESPKENRGIRENM